MGETYRENFMSKVDDLNSRASRTSNRRTNNPETLTEEKKSSSTTYGGSEILSEMIRKKEKAFLRRKRKTMLDDTDDDCENLFKSADDNNDIFESSSTNSEDGSKVIEALMTLSDGMKESALSSVEKHSTIVEKSKESLFNQISVNETIQKNADKPKYVSIDHMKADEMVKKKELFEKREEEKKKRKRKRSQSVTDSTKRDVSMLSSAMSSSSNSNAIGNTPMSKNGRRIDKHGQYFGQADAPVKVVNFREFISSLREKTKNQPATISTLSANSQNTSSLNNNNNNSTTTLSTSIIKSKNKNKSSSNNNSLASYKERRMNDRGHAGRDPEIVWQSCLPKILDYITKFKPYYDSYVTKYQKEAEYYGNSPFSNKNSNNINRSNKFWTDELHFLPSKHVNIMLRTVYRPFKPCCSRQSCVGISEFQLENPLMAYLSPDEYETALKKGSVPAEERWCYLCLLYIYNSQYHYQCEKSQTCEKIKTIFYQKTGVPGEYQHSSMITSLTATSDTDGLLEKFMVPSIGTNNCFGLVVPIRIFRSTDYTVTKVKVSVKSKKTSSSFSSRSSSTSSSSSKNNNNNLNGAFNFGEMGKSLVKEVECLQEKPSVFIFKIQSTKISLNKTEPYTYMRHFIISKPTTCSRLRFYFSDKNRTPAIGLPRLRNPCHPKNGTKNVLLPTYWTWRKFEHYKHKIKGFRSKKSYSKTENSVYDQQLEDQDRVATLEHELMPFEYIFCEDLRDTANNIEKILSGGRIRVSHLDKRPILNFPVDLNPPLSDYVKEFRESKKYKGKRLLFAYKLRCEIMNTLKVCYKNTTIDRDQTIHKRFNIFFSWSLEQYGEKLFNKQSHPPVYNKISGNCRYDPSQLKDHLMDKDISSKLLDELASRPMKIHYFASDFKFIKLRSERVTRRTPEEILGAKFASTHSWMFVEFRNLRKRFQHGEILENFAKDLFSSRNHFDFPFEPEIDLLSIPYQIMKRQYSIIWTLMVRINQTYELLQKEIKNTRLLWSKQRIDGANYIREYSNPSDSNTSKRSDFISEIMKDEKKQSIKNRNNTKLGRTRAKYQESKKIYLEQRETTYNLVLFIYTHIRIAQRMVDLKLFSDEQFESPMKRHNDGVNQFATHYEETYPFSDIMPHQGMLPDIAHLTTCVNFVDSNSAEPRTQKPPVLIYMWRKFLPKCCQGRNKEDKHYEKCVENVSYRRLTRQCLEYTLIGAYKHASKRPSFIQVLGIYKHLNSHYTDGKFLQCQKRYPRLNILAMCEALVLWIKSLTSYYHYILSKYPDYSKYERRIAFLSNNVRAAIQKNDIQSPKQFDILEKLVRNGFSTSMEIFLSENDPLSKQINQDNSSHVYRSVYINPITRLCKLISSVNAKRASFYARPSMPKELQKAVIARVKSLKMNSPIELPQILLEFNFNQRVEKLKELNVEPETIITVLKALEMIQSGSTDEDIEKRLMSMPPKGWEIFDLFMNMLHSHYSMNVIPLNEEIAKKQMEAVMRRYRTNNPDPSAYSIIFTYCCNMNRTFDAQTSGPNYYGHMKIAVDFSSNTIHCKGDKARANQRRRGRADRAQYNKLVNDIAAGNHGSLSKIYKRYSMKEQKWTAHSSYRYQPICGKGRPARIPLIGQVLQLTEIKRISNTQDVPITNAFSICTQCGAVTGFSRKMYGINDFSCNSCEQQHILKMLTPQCTACEHFLDIKNVNSWHKYNVLNDDPEGGSFLYETHYICNRCYSTSTSVFDRQYIHSKSELKMAKHRSQFGAITSIRNGDRNIKQEFRDSLEVGENRPKKKHKRSHTDNRNLVQYCLSG